MPAALGHRPIAVTCSVAAPRVATCSGEASIASTRPSLARRAWSRQNRERARLHGKDESVRHLTGLTAVTMLMLAGVASSSAQTYPPSLPDATVRTYKHVDDVALNVWIFEPEGHRPSDARPAIVFFFGGGWVQGNPAQFERHARVLSGRGMVAVLADYRVLNRHGTRPSAAVEDAKSAIRWVRAHAGEFGIDPRRIAAAGGSAGGHLAAATATVPGFEAADEDTGISSVPNALVLFNPVVIIAPVDGVWELSANLQERFAADGPADLSPFHHVRPDHPPTLIQHGTADALVPIATVRAYCARVVERGGRCDVAEYEGGQHGFFNNDPYYGPAVERMVQFLQSIGWVRSAGDAE